jgi:cytochrome c oxidase subunit 4
MASHSHDSHAHADDGMVHAHIAPTMFYIGVFAALIVLTVITVAVSYVDLGAANTVVAMVVATVKASLVAAFFMHLTHDKPFNTLCLVGSFVFLGIFFFLTNEDMSTRNRHDQEQDAHYLPSSGAIAPGGVAQETMNRLVGVAPAGSAAGGHSAPAHH